jgi:excisionase family DNA binding protein
LNPSINQVDGFFFLLNPYRNLTDPDDTFTMTKIVKVMTTILQMTQEDLRAEIKNCLRESIEEIKNLPTPEPLPDRITLFEACELTGFSKSQIYKSTMLNEIPFQKFGKRLVFSRKGLTEWMERNTISAPIAGDIMDERLAKSAKRQLKK